MIIHNKSYSSLFVLILEVKEGQLAGDGSLVFGKGCGWGEFGLLGLNKMEIILKIVFNIYFY